MKALILFFAVTVYTSEAVVIKCVQGADGSAAPTDCTGDKAEATKCSQPKFVEYTGLSKGVEYGCGGCATEKEGKTCESCTGDSCNKPKATGADFECRDYEFKTEKWVVKTTNSTCKRLKDTKIMCNMPGSKAAKDTAFANAGCGPCVGESKKNSLCADCDTAKCNGAASIFAVFVPLMAVLYILM